MSSRIDEFRNFVQKHPKLKFEVRDGNRTWQDIYEEWDLLGDNESFDKYKNTTGGIESVGGQETLRSVMNYVKGLNPDKITNTLGTVQKILGIFQSFNQCNSRFF